METDMEPPRGRGEDARSVHARWAWWETPPRTWGRPEDDGPRDHAIGPTHGAWGRLMEVGAKLLGHGNTPTGVGKTLLRLRRSSSRRKHPHGRGEDGRPPSPMSKWVETPPRAWGRPHTQHVRLSQSEKHPHGRGEDRMKSACVPKQWETPPRTWGRRSLRPCEVGMVGNTPTDVGKTTLWLALCHPIGKHPHGRREDLRDVRARWT